MNSKLCVTKAKKHGKKTQKHKTKVSKLRPKEGNKELAKTKSILNQSPQKLNSS